MNQGETANGEVTAWPPDGTGFGGARVRHRAGAPKKAFSSSTLTPPTFILQPTRLPCTLHPRSCTRLVCRGEGYPQTLKRLKLGHFSIVYAQETTGQILVSMGRGPQAPDESRSTVDHYTRVGRWASPLLLLQSEMSPVSSVALPRLYPLDACMPAVFVYRFLTGVDIGKCAARRADGLGEPTVSRYRASRLPWGWSSPEPIANL